MSCEPDDAPVELHGGREVLIGDAARQYRAALRSAERPVNLDRLVDEWFALVLKGGTLSPPEVERMAELENLIAAGWNAWALR